MNNKEFVYHSISERCYWCGKKVIDSVGVHQKCWDSLKSFALSDRELDVKHTL